MLKRLDSTSSNIRALLLALSLASAVAQPQLSSPLGVIATIKPSQSWDVVTANTSRTLNEREEVHVGTTIRCAGACSSASIEIALYSGARWWKTCTSAAPCRGTYQIPAPAEEKTGLVALARRYFSTAATLSSIFAVSRSPSDHTAEWGPPFSAVIKKNTGRIDLSPALKGLVGGEYRLRLTDSTNPKLTETVTMRWPLGSSVSTTLTNRILALEVWNAGGQPLGSPVALLVADEATFSLLSEEFKGAVRITDDWRKGKVPNDIVRHLLIKAIYSISK